MSKESCLQKAKETFLKLDFFCATQFLRYRSQSEYATCTGAMCSAVIIITFLAIFMNVLISTINRTIITYDMSIIDESTNPLTVKTSLAGNNKFMFALGIGGFDLNDVSLRYFDVSLTLVQSVNKVKTKVSIPLQACTIDKWSISTEISGTYSRMGFDKMLCVPQNVNISLQGKFSQNIFHYAQLEISKCDGTANSSRTCANDSYILSKLSGNNFYANFYFINSLINPNNQEPISYYLQDRNYIQFNYNYGGLVNLFVSKYSIATDKSIWPVEDTLTHEGGYSNQLGQFISFQNDGTTLAQFYIRRASSNVSVQRKYTKLDYMLSYIGGLFGFIMTALLFMSKYTECSYQIDAGGFLYKQDKVKDIDKDSFNIFWYIGYQIYCILTSFGCQPNWERMKAYDECREEIQKQFDVCFLFERINFLQKSVKLLFSDEQYSMLHLQRRPTLKEAIEQRQHYEDLSKLKEIPKEDFLHTEEHLANNSGLKLDFSPNSPQRKHKNLEELENKAPSPTLTPYKRGLKMLKKKSLKGDQLSKKIIENVDEQIVTKIEECFSESAYSHSHEERPSMKQQQIEEQEVKGHTRAVFNSAIQPENVIKIVPVKEEEPFTYLT